MKVLVVLNCGLCNKQGAINVETGITINNQLWGHNLNGFTRCDAPDGVSRIMCLECAAEGKLLVLSQKDERIKFSKGGG